MQFTIQKTPLLRALQHVAGIGDKKQHMAILSNVLIRTTPDGVVLTGTDLDTELTATCKPEAIDSEGEITVSGRKMLEICRNFPENAAISFKENDGRVTLTAGRSRFVLGSLPAANFPASNQTTQAHAFTVQAGAFKDAIVQCGFAMAEEDVRYYLNGLLIEFQQDLCHLIATDGHRLAFVKINELNDQNTKQMCIIPRKAIMDLLRLLNDGKEILTVSISEDHARFDLGDFSLVTKLITGKFPPYEKLLRHQGDKWMKADRDTLKAALSRVAILSHEKSRSVRFTLAPDEIRIAAHNSEQEEAEEEIAVHYQSEAMEIGFNAVYLLDVLSALPSGEVSFRLQDANTSVLIVGAGAVGAQYVIMPLRL